MERGEGPVVVVVLGSWVVDVAVKAQPSWCQGTQPWGHLRLSRDPSRSTPATVAPVRSHLLKVSWPFLSSAAALFPYRSTKRSCGQKRAVSREKEWGCSASSEQQGGWGPGEQPALNLRAHRAPSPLLPTPQPQCRL